MEVPDNIQQNAHQLCKEFIGGVWSRISKSEIIIEILDGDFVNDLFKLSLPDGVSTKNNEPRHVLMRIINGVIDRGQFGMMKENLIVSLLAEKNLAPKVYGVFDGGRLEEFIPSRVLKADDFNNSEILNAVVKKLARIHAMILPISKDPNYFYNNLIESLDAALNDLSGQMNDSPEKQNVWEKLISLEPLNEWKWLMKLMEEMDSPIVFSHNDFYSNNILLRDDPSDDLIQVVDYEASTYTFRGFDIASLLVSFTLTTSSQPPNFIMNMEKYPSEETQRVIFRTYLEEFQKWDNNEQDIDKEIERLQEESKIFLLIFIYFWISFSILTPYKTKNLDWLGFCDSAIDQYIQLKETFLQNQNM